MVAKWCKREDVYPFVLIGGFLGNFIGEEYLPEDKMTVDVPYKGIINERRKIRGGKGRKP